MSLPSPVYFLVAFFFHSRNVNLTHASLKYFLQNELYGNLRVPNELIEQVTDHVWKMRTECDQVDEVIHFVLLQYSIVRMVMCHTNLSP